MRFYNRFSARAKGAKWSLPAAAEAVAASGDYLAVRVGNVTGVFLRDGTPVEHRELPAWDEGLFLKDKLVLMSLSAEGRGAKIQPGVHVYHVITLELLWSSVAGCTWPRG